MTTRIRCVAASAAAGAILLSLVSGGAALAAEPDTGAPALIVELPLPSPRGWYTDGVDISLVAGDLEGPVASIVYSVDGGPERTIAGGTGTATIAVGGEHFFQAYAVDGAGNRSAPVTRDVNIDMAAPYISTFSQPQNAEYRVGDEVLLGYICEDDLSGVDTCADDDRIDGKLDTSTVGAHMVDVLARDVAGNERYIPYRYTVVSDDVTPPSVIAETTGTRGNGEWLTGADARVVVRLADETEVGASIHYQLPGGWPTSVGGTSTTIELPSDGVFEIPFSATDRFGNTSETQTITARRDTVAPEIARAASDATGAPVANGAVVTQGDDITFTFECTDATSGVAECDGDVEPGDLLDTADLGYHEVLITAADEAGHESSVIFEYTVEEEQEPTDPGNGGDPTGPVDPTGPGGPAAPAPGAPAPASPSRPAPAAAPVAYLASTGAAGTLGIAALAAMLLAGGIALAGAGIRTRRTR